MEADWAVEVGPNLPSIDVPWEDFLDLCRAQATVGDIEEAVRHPALRQALIRLNSNASPVFTSKCDVWTLDISEIDPDEFGAQAKDALTGYASYIDMLLHDREKLSSFEFHERWVRNITHRLRRIALSNGRIDFIVRPASSDSSIGYGVTFYSAGCGADVSSAYAAWQAVLQVAIAATMSLDSSHGMGE
jgi:hypothetical protein